MLGVTGALCAIGGGAALALSNEPVAAAILFGSGILTLGLANLARTLKQTSRRS